MKKTSEKIRAVVRIWKSKKYPTPIIIFPEWTQPNNRYNYVECMMWEPVGQHGYGHAKNVVSRTKRASEEEAAKVLKMYETHYDCSVELKKNVLISYRP